MAIKRQIFSLFFFALLITTSNSVTEEEGKNPEEVQDESELSPKLFGLFKGMNPLSFLFLKGYTQVVTPEERCKDLGGTYRQNECLKYYPTVMTFAEARMFCVHEGGDLWAPRVEDLQDPFFYQKLLVQFPNLFRGSDPSFWIGVAKSATAPFTGVDGVDVSKTPLILTNDMLDVPNFCGFLSYQGARLRFGSDECNTPITSVRPFVCEFKAEEQLKQTVAYKHPFLYKFGK